MTRVESYFPGIVVVPLFERSDGVEHPVIVREYVQDVDVVRVHFDDFRRKHGSLIVNYMSSFFRLVLKSRFLLSTPESLVVVPGSRG